MNKMNIYSYIKRVTFLVTILNICILQNTQAQIVETSKVPKIDTVPLNNQIQSKNKLSTLNKNWQQGGIFEGKTPEKEIVNLRTANSKKFNRADGKVDVIIGGPFHYKDAQGALNDIDLSIKESTDLQYPFQNKENKFISSFGATSIGGVKMNYKNNEINFGKSIGIKSENRFLTPNSYLPKVTNENSVVYENIFNDVDLEYEISTDILQHRMRFKNNSALTALNARQFIDVEEEIQLTANSILIDSLGIINENRLTRGSIYVVSNGDTSFTIFPAMIWDATFNGSFFDILEGALPNGVLRGETRVSFLSGNRIKYIIQIPVSWIKGISRVWPITVDPTVSIGGSGSLTYGSGSFGYPYPFRTNYWQQLSQTIYDKADIIYSGNITQVAYKQGINNGLANANSTIKMQSTASASFTSSSFITSGWNTALSSSTLNFTSGSGTPPNCNSPSELWRTINLTTPFAYNNTTNLIIETRFQNNSSSADGGSCGGLPGSCCIGGGWYYYTRASNIQVFGNCDCSSTYPPSATLGVRSPIIQLTITPSCAPTAPTSCTSSIGSPANGLLHWTNISCSSVSGVDGYSYEYSLNGSNWVINWFQTTSNNVNVNNGDNPNTPYYYRVRTYCGAIYSNNYTYASPLPIYTACDDPASPTVNGATNTSLNVTLNSEVPVPNPSYTTYAIYCPTTGQFIQSNGTLSNGAYYQTKSAWGTKTVTGLVPGNTYCFYAMARNANANPDIRWNSSNNSCGMTIGNSPPFANFYSNLNNIRPGTVVTFTSNSSNATSFSWTFTGGTPSNSASSGPVQVTYNTPGFFTVSLTVNNNVGPPSTNTKTAYIRVAPDGTNQLIPPPSNRIGKNNQQCLIAEPIQIGTSTYEYSHTDFTIPVVNDKLKFVRFYNALNASINGSLGYGWSHSYNYSLVNDNQQDTIWNIKYPDGHIEKFVPLYNQSQTYPWTSFGLYSGTVDSLVKMNGSTYVLYAKDNKQYQFDQSGQLSQISDLNSNVISLNYTGNNLTSIVGQGGRTLTLNYNAGNKIISVTDPLSRNCSFSYDASDNLQTVTDAKSNATNFRYNANHLVTSIVNPLLDTLVANTYDGQNRIISQRDAYSKVTSIAYNTPGNGDATITNPDNSQIIVHHDNFYRQTFYTDELGHTRIYGYDNFSNEISFTNENGNNEMKQYDSHANQTRLTKPDNTIIQSVYNIKNSPTQITDAKGNITQFAYDATTNNLSLIQFADNTSNNFGYNANGLLTTFTDGRNNSTTNTYSTNGDLISATKPVGVKNYSYDAAGRLVSVTNENSQASTIVYDNNDNITSITDALNRTILFTYDANNQLLSTTDKKGNHTYFTYDRKGRLLTKTDAKGGITVYEYNSRDNLISITDPRNNKVSFSYDLRGRKLTDSSVLGVTHYEYDNVGNLKKIIDPTNKSITYNYTNTNRVSSIKDGLNNTTSFTYDNNGNLVNTVNPLNKTTTNTYNAMNRLISVLDALNHTTSVTYDANGNRTSISDPNGHIQQYTFDAINRLISYVDGAGNSYGYGYDALGNNLSITKPTGAITKTYDAGNRLLTVTPAIGGTSTFQYDNNDNITSMANGNGNTALSYDNMDQLVQYTDPANKIVSFTYDAAGNKTSIVYPGNQAVNYSYDAANNLLTVTDWLSHTFTYTYDSAGRNTQLQYPNGIKTNYTFDGAARLTDKKTALNASNILSQSTFGLDAAGNRISENRIGNIPIPPAASNSYNYANDDRMLTNGVWNFTNDNSGNRLTETKNAVSANYVFTTDNLLSSFTDTTGLITNYAYDPMGHRLSRINTQNSAKYVLDISDGLSKVLQLTDANGNVKSTYVYGVGLLERIDSANNALFYHFDAQHNTIALTDINDSTYDKYTYDPFGVVLSHTGTTNQPFTFLGEFGVEKENTNLYYVRARYYDATNGRFLSKDEFTFELSNPQTVNKYVYSVNNPISNFDPSGLFSWGSLGVAALQLVAGTGQIIQSGFGLWGAGASGGILGPSLVLSAGSSFNDATKNFQAFGSNLKKAFTSDNNWSTSADFQGALDIAYKDPIVSKVNDINSVFLGIKGAISLRNEVPKTITSILNSNYNTNEINTFLQHYLLGRNNPFDNINELREGVVSLLDLLKSLNKNNNCK